MEEVFFMLVRTTWMKINLEPANQSVVSSVLMRAHEKVDLHSSNHGKYGCENLCPSD